MWTGINWLETGRKAIASAPPGRRTASEPVSLRQVVTVPRPKMRRGRQLLRSLYWGLCCLCLTLTAYYVDQYRSEQQWLRDKAADIVTEAHATTAADDVLP